jgi:hypothetical protein
LIEIGCVAHFHYSYEDEVLFAKEFDFKILQIWYDRDGISITCQGDPITKIKEMNYPAIIHAVLDINEMEEHIPKLVNILTELDHRELIIHPVCKSETASSETIKKLSDKVKFANQSLSAVFSLISSISDRRNKLSFYQKPRCRIFTRFSTYRQLSKLRRYYPCEIPRLSSHCRQTF